MFVMQVVETGKPCLLGSYVDLRDDSPSSAEAGLSGKVMWHFVVQKLVNFETSL